MSPPRGEIQSTSMHAGTVTLLFTDLVDSTALLERLGDDRAERLRRVHFRLLRDTVTAHRGQEVKNLGDGLMVVFASAVDAIGCAVAMQQAVDHHNVEHGDPRLQVRVGLHVGEPIRDEGDYFGTPVVIARRLCDTARGDQIIVSELVRHLVGSRGGHAFRHLGPLRLRGLAEPVVAFEVIWTAADVTRLPLPPWFSARERTTLVGREAELTRLGEIWQRARAGQRQLVFLTGEAGIGKTRLAAELARKVHAEGAVVLLGRCAEETRVSYQPFVEALRHYTLACPPEELRKQVRPPDGAELIRLLPELAERLPELSPMPPGDPQNQRYRLFQGISALLVRVSRTAPLVVVLDDIHWADKPTLLLLRHVARASADAALLLVVTYRETESSTWLAEALADLRRDQQLERLALEGLPENDVATLIGAVAGRTVAPAFSRTVRSRTEGNPFFIQEIVRHLAESGDVTERWTSQAAVDQLGIPEGVKDVVRGRLARRSKRCNRMLTVAAVIGREFGLDVLERTSDLGTAQLLDALEEAVAARIIAEVPRALGLYTFTHALIRDALYGELTTTRRVRLHLQIGEVLESLYAKDPSAHVAELAYHFFEAVRVADVQKAGSYARQAGDRAMELLAYEDAAAYYQRALHAHELVVPIDEPGRGELLLSLGGAQARAGDTDGAKQAFLRAAETARRVGSADVFARAALGFGGSGLLYGLAPGYTDDVLVALLEEALAALPADDSPLRARLLGRLSQASYWSEAQERRESLSRQAVEMADRTGDPLTRAAVLGMRHSALFGPENIEERLATASELLRLAREIGDHEHALEAHRWRVTALLEVGDIAAVDREVDSYERLAHELRQPSYIGFAAMFRGMRALLAGRFDEGETLARKSFELNQHGYLVAQMYWLYWQQGRLLDLQTLMTTIMDTAAPLAAAHAGLALTMCELGLHEQAREEFEKLAANDFAAYHHDISWLTGIATAAEVCASLGDARRAAVLYRLLLPHAARNVVVGPAAVCFGPVSLYLGRLAATMARYDEAAAHFDDALATSEAMGAPPFAANTQYAYAAMLLARGMHGAALDRLDRAFATARALGMKPLAEKVLALRGQAETSR